MRERGSSIVEVIVMMLIISISIIGIYSMVSNGQKLAKLTDDRLVAINIAKDGLESVGALRDTFVLRAYSATDCFFTVDGANYGTCPDTSTSYILRDAKTFSSDNSLINNYNVCLDPHWWYTQEHCTFTSLCGGSLTSSCKTPYTRKISFGLCPDHTTITDCIKAKVDISWWASPDSVFHLEQIFTKN